MLATLCCLLLAWMVAAQQRTETLLEKNWRFTKGDVAEAMKPEFDDTKWETVTVPHDWAIYGPFDPYPTTGPSTVPSTVATTCRMWP